MGRHSGCSGLSVRSLQRVPELPTPNSALNKDSKQDPQGSIAGPWPSHLQPLQLSGPEPGCLRHPLGSYQPVKATRLPQSTQRPLLYHAIFSHRESQPFCVIQIIKHRKSSRVKRQKNISQKKKKEKSPEKKKPTEIEISHLLDNELKEMVIRMLTNL